MRKIRTYVGDQYLPLLKGYTMSSKKKKPKNLVAIHSHKFNKPKVYKDKKKEAKKKGELC